MSFPLRVLWVALSLSIGWGIRGNFGHEIGALLPGALAAMAAVLLSGRSDWHRRLPFFALAGAFGWSIGGCMSYMQVIAYTHSGHSLTQAYGFACLFVLGFLWAAIGGATTALPAFLDRRRLTDFFAPLGAVLLVWILEEVMVAVWFNVNADYRQESPLYWYDTSWLEAAGVFVGVLGLAALRRRWDSASSLLLHGAVGWWLGFLILVVGLGLRMTPPRGDNWAGCIGTVIGIWVWSWRQGLPGVTFVSLLTGLIGGFGFATATLIKLTGMTTGWETNWHSILEQSYGLINGVGIAVALFWLARRIPRVTEEPALRPWADPLAAGLVVLGITFFNLRQNPPVWIQIKSVLPVLLGLSTQTWFDLAYLLLALAFVVLVIRHRRQPLALMPATWLGCGQWLYLALLWWMVVGNFERAVVSFAPQRLVTEGVIHLNAVLCTLGILLGARATDPSTLPDLASAIPWSRVIRRTAIFGTALMLLSVAADWAAVRAIYGDRFPGQARKHIRFGPNANAPTAKPAPGQPHP